MPQLQSLILTDRQDPAINHTFTPRDITNGVGVVAETTGTPIGDPRVSVSLGRTSSGRYKPQVRFVVPVVQTETINGISTPKVVRTGYADVSFNFDATSTEEERNDLVSYVYTALNVNKTLINDVIVKLEGVY